MFFFKANWIRKKRIRPRVIRGRTWIFMCYLCRGRSEMHLPTQDRRQELVEPTSVQIPSDRVTGF